MIVYQSLWQYGRIVINEYRKAIEEQIAMRRHGEWLIIGGDHNASVGMLEEHSDTTEADKIPKRKDPLHKGHEADVHEEHRKCVCIELPFCFASLLLRFFPNWSHGFWFLVFFIVFIVFY